MTAAGNNYMTLQTVGTCGSDHGYKSLTFIVDKKNKLNP